MKAKLNPAALSSILTGESKAHGAAFTVKSKLTGKDYTFKVSRAEYKSRWYSHVSVEQEYLKFIYLGFFADSKIIRKAVEVKTPAALAASWLLRNVSNSAALDNVELVPLGQVLEVRQNVNRLNEHRARYRSNL
jgi:hypothetical protein